MASPTATRGGVSRIPGHAQSVIDPISEGLSVPSELENAIHTPRYSDVPRFSSSESVEERTLVGKGPAP